MYTLLDRQTLSASDYAKYVKSYPVLATEPVYKLGKRQQNRDGRTRCHFRQGHRGYLCHRDSRGLLPFCRPASRCLPGTDPFVYIAQLPASQMDAMLQGASAQIGALPQTLIKQSATAYLSSEYKTIGISLSKLQSNYMLRIGGLMLLLALAERRLFGGRGLLWRAAWPPVSPATCASSSSAR